MNRSLIGTAFLVIVLVGLASSASAQQTSLIGVSATYQVVPEGYRYCITVFNDTDPVDGFYVGELSLTVYNPLLQYAAPHDIGSPHEPWYVVVSNCGYRDVLDWFSGTSCDDGIAPGHSVFGFAFTSSAIPDRVTYTVTAMNALQTGIWNSGDLHPEAVPEPSSLLAFGIGVLGLACGVRSRRGSLRKALSRGGYHV